MLTESQLKILKELAASASHDQLIWMNGYLAAQIEAGKVFHTNGASESASGYVANGAVGNGAAATNGVAASPPRKISFAYGTETGNAKRLATKLAAEAKKRGVNSKLVGLDTYKFNDLTKEDHFFVVISTQGEGEPPIPVKKFHDQLFREELALPRMKYSVLALGDTSYPLFCKTGEEFDTRFERFGAKRVVPLQRCDVDYEQDAQTWFEQVMQLVQQPSVVDSNGAPAAAVAAGTAAAPVKKGRKIYEGRILSNIVLNDRGSEKETYHIEIGSQEDIEYEAGDTIGIVPRNRPAVVERILQLAGVDGSVPVETAKASGTLRELLTASLNICYLMTNTVKKYAAITGQQIPDTRMDLADLLRIYPLSDQAQFLEVIKILLPISPRLYTIASSPSSHGFDQVHITVARDRFLSEEEQRFGLCSEFLGDQPIDSPLNFYVHKEKNFKMPPPSTDMIMIGPGTGIAPFRSFLAERDSTGADGRNWLFFGEQHFVTDFLYQSEIQAFADTGVLNKINLAFSRDQPQKIYVQHRMMANSAELFEWIQGGAHVYISGTKDPMGREVEAALVAIVAQEGKLDEAGAKAYVDKLKDERRFQLDIY